MKRSVLVTRPLPGLTRTADAVEAQGWQAIACPMLRIELFAPLPVLDVDAIAITSANAIPALSVQPRERRIFAVGSVTADAARDAGFLHVEAAEGDAVSLAELCRARGVTGPRLFLACGHGYGREWARDLRASRDEVYRVEKAGTLSEQALDALIHENVEAVLFYSGETAAAFMAACEGAPGIRLAAIRALCLSEAIAARLSKKEWRAVEWPDPLERLGHFEL